MDGSTRIMLAIYLIFEVWASVVAAALATTITEWAAVTAAGLLIGGAAYLAVALPRPRPAAIE